MNTEQLKQLASQVLTAVASFAAGRGWITADMVPTLVGAAVAVISAVWMVWSSTKANMIAKVADLPEVDAVKVNSPAIANATPPNVTLTR